jgi:3-isopropylmalate dehydrogenase
VLLAPGEGIGPEVVAATADVLSAVNAALDLGVEVTWLADLGVRGPRGLTVDDRTREAIGSALDAGVPVLTGPAGGRFVYELRAQLGLFCKLVPLRPRPELGDAGVLRSGHAAAVDILVVRDNDGGIYQGAFGWAPDGRSAYQEARYDVDQVDRVMDVAIRAAAARSGRLTVVCKPGGLPTITDLWMQRAEEAARRPEGAGVVVDSLEVDNACYQIVADPRRFDVLVTPNLIGDVVADTAALLLGSRGMSLSANYRADGAAVYQTGHGAARDLAGRDVANPLGQIASLSMLLRESLALGHAADAIDAAVGAVLASGVRTADIASPGATIVGTRAMGEAVAERVAEVAAGAGDRLGAAAGGRA